MIRRDLELAISGFRNIRAFLEKKFPEEELLSTILATGSGSTTVSGFVIFAVSI